MITNKLKQKVNMLQVVLALVLFACSPNSIPAADVPIPSSTVQILPAAETGTSTHVPSPTTTRPPTDTRQPATATVTSTLRPSETPSALPSETPVILPTATNTPTYQRLMAERIVFYVIQSEKGRSDACGNIKTVPIISKRMRTGDKIQDVQIALNMLFGIGSQTFITYYNALWDTELSIAKFEYIPKKDYMIIDFAGYFPVHQMTNCDKHAIREQVWTTFFHYGFKEKTFRVNGHYMIDQLGGH